MRDPGNVDAARGDVRRYEHAYASRAEPIKRTNARVLHLVSVKCSSGKPVLNKMTTYAIRTAFRARENDSLVHRWQFEKIREQRALVL